MKAKHIINANLPLSQQTYNELRKELKLGNLKWSSFPRKLKNAYHNFEEAERETDFEERLHKGTISENDYKTSI